MGFNSAFKGLNNQRRVRQNSTMKLYMGCRNTSIAPFAFNLGASGILHALGALTMGNNPCTNLIGG